MTLSHVKCRRTLRCRNRIVSTALLFAQFPYIRECVRSSAREHIVDAIRFSIYARTTRRIRDAENELHHRIRQISAFRFAWPSDRPGAAFSKFRVEMLIDVKEFSLSREDTTAVIRIPDLPKKIEPIPNEAPRTKRKPAQAIIERTRQSLELRGRDFLPGNNRQRSCETQSHYAQRAPSSSPLV